LFTKTWLVRAPAALVGLAAILLTQLPAQSLSPGHASSSHLRFSTSLAGLTTMAPTLSGNWDVVRRVATLDVEGSNAEGFESTAVGRARLGGPRQAGAWCVTQHVSFTSFGGLSPGSFRVALRSVRGRAVRSLGSTRADYPAGGSPDTTVVGTVQDEYSSVPALGRHASLIVAVSIKLVHEAQDFSTVITIEPGTCDLG